MLEPVFRWRLAIACAGEAVGGRAVGVFGLHRGRAFCFLLFQWALFVGGGGGGGEGAFNGLSEVLAFVLLLDFLRRVSGEHTDQSEVAERSSE